MTTGYIIIYTIVETTSLKEICRGLLRGNHPLNTACMGWSVKPYIMYTLYPGNTHTGHICTCCIIVYKYNIYMLYKVCKYSQPAFNTIRPAFNSSYDIRSPCIILLPKSILCDEALQAIISAPMRPIVSTINSPSYKLAKELARILTPLAGNTAYTVRNSTAFVERIRGLQTTPQDTLVSFDVKNLFTQVPVEAALTVVEDRLYKDPTLSDRTSIPVPQLVELTSLCLRSTYFQLGEKFYEQTDGAAMGSPLSPVIANLYLESLEETAIRSAPLKPKPWVRYVDDTFVIWPHGPDRLRSFHQHLNKQHPKIQFTVEEEKDDQLPFLDVCVSKEGGRLLTSVYRKPTHTERYIPYHSHHHPRTTTGVLRCMRDRARSICHPTKMQQEMDHLNQVFQANGFPENLVKKTLTTHPPPLPETSEPQQQVDEAPKILCTPYIKGLSEKIAKVCAPLGVKPVFRPKKTLKRELMQVKNRTPEQKQTGVVYEIPCKDCPEVYVGETKRTLKVRLSEHRQAVKRGDPKNGIAVHVQKTNHCINWEGATVQRRAEGFWLRRTVEAIQIRKATPNMNLDSGLLLPMVWNPILNPHPSPHT